MGLENAVEYQVAPTAAHQHSRGGSRFRSPSAAGPYGRELLKEATHYFGQQGGLQCYGEGAVELETPQSAVQEALGVGGGGRPVPPGDLDDLQVEFCVQAFARF